MKPRRAARLATLVTASILLILPACGAQKNWKVRTMAKPSPVKGARTILTERFVFAEGTKLKEGFAEFYAEEFHSRLGREAKKVTFVDAAEASGSGEPSDVTLRFTCTTRDIKHPLSRSVTAAVEAKLVVQMVVAGEVVEEVYFVAEGRGIGLDGAPGLAKFGDPRYGLLFDTTEELSEDVADYLAFRIAGRR